MYREFAVLLLAAGCASSGTVPGSDRSALLDPLRPFGLEWRVSDELRLQYLKTQEEECKEYFSDLPKDELQEELEWCLNEPISSLTDQDSSLPHPFEQGYFRAVLDGQSGTVIEYAHVFNLWLASFPEPDDIELAREQSVFESEYAIWETVTRETLGAPDSVGNWNFGGYQRIEEGDANCQAWIREPSVIILCKDRLFTHHAGEASISMFNLKVLGVNELKKDVLGDR